MKLYGVIDPRLDQGAARCDLASARNEARGNDGLTPAFYAV
jgi:hypothetical protein